MGIKSIVRSSVINVLTRRFQKQMIAFESCNMDKQGFELLTKEEQQSVVDTWGLKDFTYHRMFKSYANFDVRYVSDGSFFPTILRSLNPYESANSFERKSLYNLLYHEIPQPKSIVCCFDGTYIVEKSFVSKEDAIKLLKTKETFIIKPTEYSTQGKNVRLIKTAHDNIEEVLDCYGKNFIAQEVLGQSERTSIFHKSSLNSFRITTLNINGKVTLCNILFRCGQGDSVVDNGGAGGLMVGVMPDGSFMDFAYDNHYHKYAKTKDGVEFKGKCIKEMPEIINQVLSWHTAYLPHMGIVGWDIALNEHEKPIMIEVNLRLPGIQFEQLCTETPLFGDRTDEVIDYTKNHNLKITDLLHI